MHRYSRVSINEIKTWKLNLFPLSLVLTILVFSGPVYQKDSFFSHPAFSVSTVSINHGAAYQMRFWTKFQKHLFYPNTSQGSNSSTNKLADTSKAACFLSSILGKQNCGSQNIVNLYDFILFLFYTDFYCLLYYCNFIFYFRRPKGHCNIKSSKFAVNKFQTEINLSSNRNAEFKNVLRILQLFMYKLDNKQWLWRLLFGDFLRLNF